MAGTPRSSSGRRVWLLEVDLGWLLRLSTEVVDLVDLVGSIGITLRYEAGLIDPGTSLAVSAGREEVSISVDLVTEIDFAALISDGIPMIGRRVTLLRYEVGSAYERAEVVFRGQISGVSYGSKDEPVTLVIRRSLAEVSATLPAPQAVIDRSTWPVTTPNFIVYEESEGQPYPIIIGSPGFNASGAAYAAVPVYYAQFFGAGPASSYICVGDETIAATTVRWTCRGEENATPIMDTPQDLAVSQVTDLLGRTLSVVSHPGSGGIVLAAVSMRVGYNATAGSGVSHRGAAVRGAGDVLRWLFDLHLDYPVDWSRFEGVVSRLNAYKIDAALITPTNLYDWYQAEVLPILPIEMRESIFGIYPHLWRWNATARDSVAYLDATLGEGRVSRVSAITTDQGDIYNEIVLEYGRSADGDRYQFRRVITSDARALARGSSPSSDKRIRGSALLGDSQRVQGLRVLTLQLGAVWDHPTAELILRDKAIEHGWLRRRVSYEGGQWLESLVSGDVVTVTDPEVNLNEEVAIVMDTIPSGDLVTLDLLLLDHPRQRGRAA